MYQVGDIIKIVNCRPGWNMSRFLKHSNFVVKEVYEQSDLRSFVIVEVPGSTIGHLYFDEIMPDVWQ